LEDLKMTTDFVRIGMQELRCNSLPFRVTVDFNKAGNYAGMIESGDSIIYNSKAYEYSGLAWGECLRYLQTLGNVTTPDGEPIDPPKPLIDVLRGLLDEAFEEGSRLECQTGEVFYVISKTLLRFIPNVCQPGVSYSLRLDPPVEASNL
jgi:hypothetical protein